MNILLDHNVPKKLRPLLRGHVVTRTVEMGWEELANGELLQAAAGTFDVLLSIDKKMRHEHNLETLPLPILVPDARNNTIPVLEQFIPHLLAVLAAPMKPAFYLVHADGRVDVFDRNDPKMLSRP